MTADPPPDVNPRIPWPAPARRSSSVEPSHPASIPARPRPLDDDDGDDLDEAG
jgi:hypothetical protein